MLLRIPHCSLFEKSKSALDLSALEGFDVSFDHTRKFNRFGYWITLAFAQQLRQLGDVRRDPPRLILRVIYPWGWFAGQPLQWAISCRR